MQTKDYWYPWYPVKFRRKTIHLPRAVRHAYRDLIDWYMETGEPLPNSDVALASITGMDADGWCHASAMVLSFFAIGKDGLLHQEECDLALAEQRGRSKFKSEAGKKGAKKRWQKQTLNGTCYGTPIGVAMADPMANDSTRQDKTVTTDDKSSVVRTTPLVPSSNLKAAPQPKEKKNGKHELPQDFEPNATAIALCLELGVDSKLVLDEIRDWAASKRPRYFDWQAVYRGSVRRRARSGSRPIARNRGPIDGAGSGGGNKPAAGSIAEATLRVAARYNQNIR